MKWQKKKATIVTLSAMLVSGTLLANSTFAADATKTLKAVYSNIKLVYNGQTVTSSTGQEPFVVDGTTYVPLRMAGEALGKSLYWDASTKQILITDVTSSADKATIESLNEEVEELNEQITSLKAELNTANSTLTSKNSTITSLESQIKSLRNALDDDDQDLDDLEDDLNDDYEDYYDLDADITLSGDEDDITVKVKVEEDIWEDLTTTKQKSFLQKIVDDILDEFDDADVSGTVRDKDSSKLISFTVSSSGTVKLSD